MPPNGPVVMMEFFGLLMEGSGSVLNNDGSVSGRPNLFKNQKFIWFIFNLVKRILFPGKNLYADPLYFTTQT